jgi:hypothetical protein
MFNQRCRFRYANGCLCRRIGNTILEVLRAFAIGDPNRIFDKYIGEHPQNRTTPASSICKSRIHLLQFLLQTVEQLFIHKPKSSLFILYFLSLLTVGVASLSQRFAPQTVRAWGCRLKSQRSKTRSRPKETRSRSSL